MAKVGFGACLFLYLGVCLLLIPIGTDDIRMLDVFSLDEATAVAVVDYLFRTGWELNTFSYGGLFYYLPLALVKCFAAFGFEISHQLIVYIMRGVCSVAGLGCLTLVYLIGRLLGGQTVGLVSAWLLASNPTFLRWSIETHPDLPQLFWLTCSLWVSVRAVALERSERFWLAGLFAGLAFATKYAGIFLLPILGLTVFWLYSSQESWFVWPPKQWQQMVSVLGLTGLAFGVGYIVTNPFAFVHFDTFLHDVSFESQHLSIGHVFRSISTGQDWLSDFARLIGVGNFVVFICTVGILIGRRMIKQQHLLLLCWIALLLFYLIFFVNLRGARYLLPILPAAIIFVSCGYQIFYEYLQKKWQGALGIVLTGVLFLSFTQTQTSWAFVLQRIERVSQQTEIVAGKWIGENFSSETTVLYHSYAYVPAKFDQVFRTTNMDYLLVNHFQPDLLVVRDASTHEYEDPKNATRAVIGPQAFWARHYFYTYLKDGLLEDYRQIIAFEGIRIYQRTQGKDGGRANLSWTQRRVLLSENKFTGVSEAMARLGVLYVSRGEELLARDALVQACSSNEGLTLLIKQESLYLRQHNEVAAQKLLGALRGSIQDLPHDKHASIHLQIGRIYLEMGAYKNASQAFEKAIALQPKLRDAYFDLGLVDVIQGNVEDARVRYGQAVKSFGKYDGAADLLHQLIQSKYQVGVAQTILAEFF
ncbi:MAG: 4-amino-4-deoxy-L-arabinose transferase-like glycosyltransferase [Candidatus Latescibacterota bacterium]|jgi:4-amino-4-deoxy-L-arabinose transferase-like glycosyltransferase